MLVTPAPIAVRVYMVVDISDTGIDPAARGETAPTPWSIDKLVALPLVQDRVEAPPPAIA